MNVNEKTCNCDSHAIKKVLESKNLRHVIRQISKQIIWVSVEIVEVKRVIIVGVILDSILAIVVPDVERELCDLELRLVVVVPGQVVDGRALTLINIVIVLDCTSNVTNLHALENEHFCI